MPSRSKHGQGAFFKSAQSPYFNSHYLRVCLSLVIRRLKEFKDTCHLVIFTLDLVTNKYPIITTVENLPHDCFTLLPCDSSLGGVVILSANALIYVDQASRRMALAVNGWAERVTDMPLLPVPGEKNRDLHLEGSKTIFVDERTFFLITREGEVYPVEIVLDGRTALRLSLGEVMSITTTPACLMSVGVRREREGDHHDHIGGGAEVEATPTRGDVIFVGSTVGPSVLLKTTRVEEEVPKDEQKADGQMSMPAAVADNPMAMDLDDDDGKSRFFFHQ